MGGYGKGLTRTESKLWEASLSPGGRKGALERDEYVIGGKRDELEDQKYDYDNDDDYEDEWRGHGQKGQRLPYRLTPPTVPTSTRLN